MSLYYLFVFLAVYFSPKSYIASGILLSYGELVDTIEDGDDEGDEAGVTSHIGSGSAFQETGLPTQVICFKGRKHVDWMMGGGVIMAFTEGSVSPSVSQSYCYLPLPGPIRAPPPFPTSTTAPASALSS